MLGCSVGSVATCATGTMSASGASESAKGSVGSRSWVFCGSGRGGGGRCPRPGRPRLERGGGLDVEAPAGRCDSSVPCLLSCWGDIVGSNCLEPLQKQAKLN